MGQSIHMLYPQDLKQNASLKILQEDLGFVLGMIPEECHELLKKWSAIMPDDGLMLDESSIVTYSEAACVIMNMLGVQNLMR